MFLPHIINDEAATAELMLVLSEIAVRADKTGSLLLTKEEADWLDNAGHMAYRAFRELQWKVRIND
jgi:hypothetical protein